MVVTTEKYLSFQLSRIRFASLLGDQSQSIVLTGSFQEQVNSLCAWQYNVSKSYPNNCFTSQIEDGLPGVLEDSADDPKLVASFAHPGDVQQLRFHSSSQLIFTASSLGFLGIFKLNTPDNGDGLFAISPLHQWTPPIIHRTHTSDKQATSLSEVNISSDASQAFIADDLGRLSVVDVETLSSSITLSVQNRGFDVTSVNAIEVIDDACIATANQVGHLNVWDIRSPQINSLPQRRIIPIGEPRPLVSLSQHPGQPHLLAVGGVSNTQRKTVSTSYIWDLRAEKHPLSELNCPGTAVWEIRFHPTRPEQLYLASEAAGLVRIQSNPPSDSWSYMQGCRTKLSAVCISQNPSDYCSVNTFDLIGDVIVCGRDNCVLQTIQDSSMSKFSYA